MYNQKVDRETTDLSFDWDEENTSHLARHRIQPSEVEELFRNNPLIRGYEVVDGEERWMSVGATTSLRVLVLVFTVRNEKIRPITGWEADRRTHKQYFVERGT